MAYSNIPTGYKPKCDAQTATDCAERIWHAYPVLSEIEPGIWLEEIMNLFQEHLVEDVREAVSYTLRKMKKRPTIAHMAEQLEKKKKDRDRHEDLMAARDIREVRPISEMTDQEVVDALVARGNKGIPWPEIETERGLELMRCAARRFVLQMNPRLDYHRHTFFRLRARELIAINEKIPEPA